jgi:hypothetical protein
MKSSGKQLYLIHLYVNYTTVYKSATLLKFSVLHKITKVNYVLFVMNLTEVPSQPGMPEVIEVTDNTITLHWKAPESDGNSPITNYILEYHDKSDFT